MVGIAAIVGGIIDEPAAPNAMQLRSPNGFGIFASPRRRPNNLPVVLADRGNGAGLADSDTPLAIAIFAIVIGPLVEDHPRVGGMWWQYRVYGSCLSTLLKFLLLISAIRCPARGLSESCKNCRKS